MWQNEMLQAWNIWLRGFSGDSNSVYIQSSSNLSSGLANKGHSHILLKAKIVLINYISMDSDSLLVAVAKKTLGPLYDATTPVLHHRNECGPMMSR